ncbi:hypothetical protein PsorP6_017130 [Peronosclerospora sorghi]|uniref:Uncharacterized protein n=1 Tax=Peronosclerospora sorghi TaxID=230839 RepID=A0ACC0WE53_9STRA|nr:hypothetical protein PsorP6_017130 [Peronosclerospora sorghi]
MDLHSGMNELFFVLQSQDPVEEVARVTATLNVRDKGESSLPMGPVLHSPERLLSTASLDDAQDVNMAALDAFRSLFPRCLNPFYASFSTTQAASLVFTKMSVFYGKVFMVDPNDGSLCRQYIGGFLESYTSLLDRMDRMFPPIYSLTCTEHESVRSSCSTTSLASLEDEYFVSEPVRFIGWSQDFADEAYNDVNFWRIEPLLV